MKKKIEGTLIVRDRQSSEHVDGLRFPRTEFEPEVVFSPEARWEIEKLKKVLKRNIPDEIA